MKRISIQGAILSAIPRDPILDEWVAAGLLTPANYFTAALREAEETGEEIEVWINSQGGDVDAGNEMLAAFQSFKGYKCVTVGGLAASMAAYFALQCGARVECHENTRFMFHSARTVLEAGPGALRDIATALDKINAPVKARLKALGVPAEIVDEGFRDDRSLWLSADEAKQYGIVAKIVKGAAAIPARPAAATLSALAAAVPAAAAFYQNPETTAAMNDETETPAEPAAAPDPATPPETPAADPDTVSAPADPAPAEDPATPAEEAPAEVQAQADPGLRDLPDSAATLAAALSRAEALAAATLKRAETAEKALAAAERTLAQYEKTAADLGARAAALAESLDKEKAAHAALVGRVLSPAEAPAASAAGTPHLDAWRALRGAAERETYFAANKAAIHAELRAVASRR